MNTTFKISALALFVSVTTTGCIINDKSSDVKAPTQVTQPSTTQNSSTEPTTQKSPSEQTTPASVASNSSTAAVQPTSPAVPGTSATPNETASVVDSQGKKWRIVNQDTFDNTFVDYISAGRIKGDLKDNPPTVISFGDFLRLKEGFQDSYEHNDVIKNVVLDPKIQFDLDELSKKDGKPLLGTHSGSVKIAQKNTPEMNYLFTNQPYSSYGAIFTDHNNSALFAVIQSAGKQGSNAEFKVYDEDAKGRLTWNENVAGDATYKGNVIAVTLNKTNKLVSAPKEDGTITLNAHFGETWEKSTVSGTLQSNTVGTIDLPKANIDRRPNYITDGIGAAQYYSNKHMNNSNITGTYNVAFGGKNLNDAVGKIDLNIAPNTEYLATFGATKQPK
ncbi:hypothetical protein [Ursidibacter sp. B-7004-1]